MGVSLEGGNPLPPHAGARDCAPPVGTYCQTRQTCQTCRTCQTYFNILASAEPHVPMAPLRSAGFYAKQGRVTRSALIRGEIENSELRCGHYSNILSAARHSLALQCECGASRSQGGCVIHRPHYSIIPEFQYSTLSPRLATVSPSSASAEPRVPRVGALRHRQIMVIGRLFEIVERKLDD